MLGRSYHFFFFFNDTATTEIYTLSLHDALPIYHHDDLALRMGEFHAQRSGDLVAHAGEAVLQVIARRSEEHTSELQSQSNLVCRLLLEKKKIDGQASNALLAPGTT